MAHATLTRSALVLTGVHLLGSRVFGIRDGNDLHEVIGNRSFNIAERSKTQATLSAFAVPFGACECDLRELECLPAADCFQHLVRNDQRSIAVGAEVRNKLRKSVTFQSREPFFIPVGKCFQKTAIKNWKTWLASNMLSLGFEKPLGGPPSLADAWQKYEFCRDGKLSGTSCFFKDLPSDESPSAANLVRSPEKHVLKEEVDQIIANLYRATGQEALPFDSLLSFAHITRMQFNLQPSITNVIDKHAARINPGKGVLRVSLHVRRADACDHIHDQEDHHYAGAPSAIDSHAQVSGRRLCYKMNVYTDKLKEILERYNMPLAVYLSTDDTESVLEEIRETDPALYEKTTFHFPNYSRSNFAYEGFIEGTHDNHGFMTEASLVDLWTLSHGQVYVGHLGSRFGKVAYLLATAHHNRPIPFVSVDGHSLCCEIDENCAKATPAMKTMVDCLTFFHSDNPKMINKDYWEVGSTVRYK